jgi:membrane protein implicated in regulation of membrane protease activity
VVALGLVLLVLCLIVGAGVVLANPDAVTAEAFGVSLSGLTVGGLFLLGAALGALALLGLGLMLAGAARRRAKKKAMQREVHSVRGEQETLAEENARLQAELERQHDADVYPSDGAAHGQPARGRHRA